MNYTTLKTTLNTYATTAGISEFYYGYLDEFDPQNRAGTYPAMVVVPINRPLKTRSKGADFVTAEIEIYIMNSYKPEDTSARVAVWDGIDLKMVAFIQAMTSGTVFSVLNPDSIPVEVYPFGYSTDSVVAIKYTLNVQIFC